MEKKLQIIFKKRLLERFFSFFSELSSANEKKALFKYSGLCRRFLRSSPNSTSELRSSENNLKGLTFVMQICHVSEVACNILKHEHAK